ncbi:MAG: peptidylprolyl isomerase [Anaerolineae bacterium]|nr:peptidylprolyl isomerase [Anaerolineae bacterium]
MRYFILSILTITLSACTVHPFQDSSQSPPIAPIIEPSIAQTTESVPEIQLEFPASTTTSDRAFEDGRPLAARVNNQPIFLDTYQKQVAHLEQALKTQNIDLTSEEGQTVLAQVRRQVLDSLIDQLVIERAASQRGLTVSNETLEAKTQESIEQGQGQTQFEEWLAFNNLTMEEFKETLRSQLIANQMFEHITGNVPDTADQVQLRHILVADEATARAIIEQLKTGEDFAALAQAHSLDESSRANGGSLGWFPQGLGLVPPEVEAIAFSIQPGEVSGPIKSALGFHIIQLENRETARPLGDMHQALKQQIFINWLKEQRSATTIERYVGP